LERILYAVPADEQIQEQQQEDEEIQGCALGLADNCYFIHSFILFMFCVQTCDGLVSKWAVAL